MTRATLTVDGISVAPGHVGYGAFRVAQLNDGSPVEVPFCAVNGMRDGPVAWIHSGVHGDEYTGLGGIQRLLTTLDPADLSGAVIAVPMVNILAYRAGLRMAPQDGLDANRIWPGRTLENAMHVFAHSEMVIRAIWDRIIEHADFVVDCHDGSKIADMAPYASYFSGPAEWEDSSRQLAEASGLDIIWRTESQFVEEKFPGSSAAALAQANVPAVFLEVGGQGRLVDEDVARMHDALVNILRHRGLLAGRGGPASQPRRVLQGHWLRAGVGGVFHPRTTRLASVKRGDVVGIISDLFGREKERIVAPVDGIVIGIRTATATASGEYAGNVAEVA